MVLKMNTVIIVVIIVVITVVIVVIILLETLLAKPLVLQKKGSQIARSLQC